MKRIAMVIVAIVIAVLIHSQATNLEKLMPSNAQWCEIYVSGENNGEIHDFSATKTTNMTIYRKNCISGGIKIPKLDNTLGVAIKYDCGNVTLDSLLSAVNGKVLVFEKLENSILYYGYSNRLGNTVFASGEQINFQIAVSSDGMIFGSPLILGSY